MKAVINFDETAKNIISIDGNEYEVPKRTKAIMERLGDREDRINSGELDEYDGNMLLLCILFGEENAEKINPEGENVDLDRLEKICKKAVELFWKAKNSIDAEALDRQLEPVNKAFDKLKKAAESVDKISKMQK